MPSPLSRRQLIAHAWRAGVGIGALALAGCSPPETYNSRREAPAPNPQDRPLPPPQPQPAPAAQQEEAAAPPSAGAAADPARTTQSQSQETAQPLPIAAPPVPADAVDPLLWRERYHWRELAKLPGQDAGPAETASLHIHALHQRSWTPFDPQMRGPNPGTYLPLIYSQLLVMAAGDFQDAHRGEIEGDLAAGWEIPEPAKLVFQIRRDVQWPDQEPLDGRPLTASDVRISHDAFLFPALPQRSAYEAVERIEADDDEMTITFHLREPASYLPAKMTDPLHVIGPPHQLDDPSPAVIPMTGAGFMRPEAFGTGPFRLEYAGAFSWGTVRNPRYFKRDPGSGRRLPHLHRLRGGVLMSKSTQFPSFPPRREVWSDWADSRFHALELLDPSELDQSRALFPDLVAQVVAPAPGRGSFLTFRAIRGGPFADIRVRQALSSAIDRIEIGKRTQRGLAAPDCGHDWTHVVDDASPSGFREWPWTPEELGPPYAFDPAHARSLLSAAGFNEHSPLEIALDAGGGSAFSIGVNPAEVATVAHQWQTHLGPAVQVRLLPRSTRSLSQGNDELRLVEAHQDARIMASGWPPEYMPDPDHLTYGRLHSSVNPLAQDPALDELCERQRRDLDPARRSETLEQIRRRDLELSWRLPLVNPYGLVARHSDVFNIRGAHIAHGFDLNPKQFERAWRLPRW